MLKATLTALALDSLHDSHPISVEVTDPDEVESIFDAISYSKVRPSSSARLVYNSLWACFGICNGYERKYKEFGVGLVWCAPACVV